MVVLPHLEHCFTKVRSTEVTNSLKVKIPSLGSLFVEIIPLSHRQLISCIDLNKGFLILFDWYPETNGQTNPTSKKNSNRPRFEHTQDSATTCSSRKSLYLLYFGVPGVCFRILLKFTN